MRPSGAKVQASIFQISVHPVHTRSDINSILGAAVHSNVGRQFLCALCLPASTPPFPASDFVVSDFWTVIQFRDITRTSRLGTTVDSVSRRTRLAFNVQLSIEALRIRRVNIGLDRKPRFNTFRASEALRVLLEVQTK